MNEAPRTVRAWAQRHSPTLINGACLLAAWWLAPLLSRGPALPLAGLALALATLVSLRTLAPGIAAGVRHHAWLYLKGQLAAGVACAIAGRVLGDWPWPAYALFPLWTGLTALILIRHVPRERRRDPLASLPGADTALTGALLVGVTAFLFGRLALAEGAGWLTVLVPTAGWLIADRWPVARWQDGHDGRSRLTRFGLRLAAWATGVGTTLFLVGGEPFRIQAALLVVVTFALALFGLSHRQRLVIGSENAARTLFGLAVAALASFYACHRMLGQQDAQWYMNTLADFLAQVRAGAFPVFVGQSEHLFNGGVLPIRFAPLFQHYGLLLDLLTLRSLPVDALQNGVVMGALLGAAVTSWAVIARILPGRPWITAGLSLFYLTCPGVLAIAYAEDLYMTWTTLPWLPLVFGGCVLSLRSPGASPLLLTGTALGLVWWGHSPVALWTTIAVTAIQAARLAGIPPREWPWRALLAGGGACLAIALYPLVSVLAVPVQTGAAIAGSIDPELLIRINLFIRESFAGIAVPTFAQARSLADYQLGWALLLALGLGLATMLRLRAKSPGAWMTLLVPLAFQALLVPIPGLTAAIWSHLPAALVNPTGAWPMQRLYVIMAACLVCATAAVLHRCAPGSRPLPAWLSRLLVAGMIWSALSAAPLVQLKGGQRRELALASDLTRPENHVLTRYAYLFFDRLPAYYSHGHVDPLYEQRFLSPDDGRVVGGNPDAILAPAPAGRVLSEGSLTAELPHAGAAWRIAPRFMLEPRKRYALQLHFAQPAAPGVLLVTGGGLRKNYALPRYGEKFAFGSGPESSSLLPLHTSGSEPVEVTLQFVAEATGQPVEPGRFGRYRWIEIDPDRLPVKVTGWIPYRAEVDAPAPVRLETPRMFQPGYRATVNGAASPVEKSPEGLVAVPVPAGRSTVVVTYDPPVALSLSYGVSLTAIALCLVLLARAASRPAVAG